MKSISFKQHNHADCQQTAIEHAKQICQLQGERLTPLRHRVLEFILDSHEPIKAYDLLARLQQVHTSSAPPTVYRALDFLQSLGLVHKIESLNAYIGCMNPLSKHQCQFLICTECGLVEEIEGDNIQNEVELMTKKINFVYTSINLEINGVCARCR